MTRHIRIWLALGAVYLLFLAWHHPLKGPLTETEVDALLAQSQGPQSTDWAIAAEFEAFLRSDDGRPFVMINLIELRDQAIYRDDAFPNTLTGAEAGAQYGRQVLPLLLQRGSYPITLGDRSHTLINSLGPAAGTWDSIAIVRYRSRRDLIEMIQSDAFRKAEPHKWASLENTLVAPAQLFPSLNVVGYIPFAFLLIGVTASLWPRAQRHEH